MNDRNLSYEEFREFRIQPLEKEVTVFAIDNSDRTLKLLYSKYLEGWYHDRSSWISDEIPNAYLEAERQKKSGMIQEAIDL